MSDTTQVTKHIEDTSTNISAWMIIVGAVLKYIYHFIKDKVYSKKDKHNSDHISLDLSKDRYKANIAHIQDLLKQGRIDLNADKVYLSVLYAVSEETQDVSQMKLSIIVMDCKDGVANDMENWQDVPLTKFNGIVKHLLLKHFGILYKCPDDWVNVKYEFEEWVNVKINQLQNSVLDNQEEIAELLDLHKSNNLPYQLQINDYMQHSLNDQGCDIMFNYLISRLNVPSAVLGVDYYSKIDLKCIEHTKEVMQNIGYKIENEKWVKTK